MPRTSTPPSPVFRLQSAFLADPSTRRDRCAQPSRQRTLVRPMPSRTALLVVDVQTGLLRADPPLHERDRFLANMCRLIESARASQVPVVYLRHETTGGELAPG